MVVGWAIEEGLPEKVTLSQVFAAEQKELPAWGRKGTRDEGEGIRWKGARSQGVQSMQWAPFLSVDSFSFYITHCGGGELGRPGQSYGLMR